MLENYTDDNDSFKSFIVPKIILFLYICFIALIINTLYCYYIKANTKYSSTHFIISAWLHLSCYSHSKFILIKSCFLTWVLLSKLILILTSVSFKCYPHINLIPIKVNKRAPQFILVILLDGTYTQHLTYSKLVCPHALPCRQNNGFLDPDTRVHHPLSRTKHCADTKAHYLWTVGGNLYTCSHFWPIIAYLLLLVKGEIAGRK